MTKVGKEIIFVVDYSNKVMTFSGMNGIAALVGTICKCTRSGRMERKIHVLLEASSEVGAKCTCSRQLHFLLTLELIVEKVTWA